MSDGVKRDTSDYQRLLLDGVPSILAYWDSDLRCRYGNRAYAQWLAVDPDRLVGMALQDVLGPELLALNEPYIRAAFAGQKQVFERAVPQPDGTTRHSLITYVPDIAGDAVVGLLVQVADVTPLKQARDALERSQEYQRELLALASEGIVVADGNGRYIDANAACCSLLGYRRDELLGKSFDELIPPQDRQRLAEARTTLQAGEPHADEWTLVRKDGSRFAAEVRAKFLSDGRRVSLLRDVSGYKRAISAGQQAAEAMEREVQRRAALLARTSQDLQFSEARLRGILDSAVDAIITVDATQTIVQANEAAAQMFRCPIDTLVGGSIDRFIPERYRRMHRAALQAFGDSPLGLQPMGATREVTALRADGEEFPVAASISHLMIGGQQLFTVIHRDITAQRAAQADLEYSHAALQRLIAQQDRVQDEERARISRELHDDLQQTLAAIRIDVSALGDDLRQGARDAAMLLAELDELTEQAVVSTRRVIDDLRPKPLEDVGLLPALNLMTGRFSQHHGIACEVSVPQALSDRLMAMPALGMCLYRVTQEALNNVAKHSAARKVCISLAESVPGQVCLRIVDDGCGMRSRDQYKPRSSGLAGMRERVRSRNGVLRVEGRPGSGTVVEVLVPLEECPGPDPASATHVPGPADTVTAPDTGFDLLLRDSADGPPDVARLPRLLGQAASQTLQAVIDAMAGCVAVIDRHGIVRYVNRGWIDFGLRNGQPPGRPVGPGTDYLDVCRRAAVLDPSAEVALKGLEEVIEDRRRLFTCDYPCDSAETSRWFRMYVTPMSNGEILVTHILLDESDADKARAVA